jgi:hypothetical protein
MTDQDLDAVYTRMAYTMSGLGEANAPLFLARFAMLAVIAIGDAAKLTEMLDTAARIPAGPDAAARPGEPQR